MDPEKRTKIARSGGMAVDPDNRAFARDRSLASAAGKKGGTKAAALAKTKRERRNRKEIEQWLKSEKP
jgi:general stress protein YciG